MLMVSNRLSVEEQKIYANTHGANIIYVDKDLGLHLCRMTMENGKLYYETNEHFDVGEKHPLPEDAEVYWIGDDGTDKRVTIGRK